MNTAVFLVAFWATLGVIAGLISAFGLFILINLVLAIIGAIARKDKK